MWNDVEMSRERPRQQAARSNPHAKRIAVIGSGVSGIGALWALDTGTEHEVHLFEADEVLGGHTNTVPWRHHDEEVMVDTGFIVYNKATYR